MQNNLFLIAAKDSVVIITEIALRFVSPKEKGRWETEKASTTLWRVRHNDASIFYVGQSGKKNIA
jgi:hypothetical protein